MLPIVVVCRGCCCGTARKVPGRDHDADLRDLRRRLDGVARVRTSDCLGPCEDANVAVVVPTSEQRRAGARSVWFRTVNADAGWEEVIDHVSGVERAGPNV